MLTKTLQTHGNYTSIAGQIEPSQLVTNSTWLSVNYIIKNNIFFKFVSENY